MVRKENMPTFRTAIGGYNKEDINNYIKAINSDFLSATREYDERIHSLEKALQERDEKLAELKKETETLSAEKKTAEEAETLAAALRERCDSLTDEVAGLKEEKLASEIREEAGARRIEELQNLIEELKQGEDSEISHKAELYDKMSGQIGRVMLDARENAGEIVTQAHKNAADVRAKAEAVLTEAEGKAERILRDAESERAHTEDRLRRLKTEFGRAAAEAAENIGKEYYSLIDGMRGKLQGLSDEFCSETQRFMGKLESECDIKPEEILKKTGAEICSERYCAAVSGTVNGVSDTWEKSSEDNCGSGKTESFFGKAPESPTKYPETETEKTDIFSSHDRFFKCGDRGKIDYGSAD